MKAAVLESGGKLELREVPRPEPASGKILVRVAACGICHMDLHCIDHGVATFKSPVILGHEVSGTIAAMGAGVVAVANPDGTPKSDVVRPRQAQERRENHGDRVE